MKIVFFECFLSLEFLQSLKQDGSSSIHFSGFLESEKYLVPNVCNTVQIRHFPNATVLYGCDFGLKTQKLRRLSLAVASPNEPVHRVRQTIFAYRNNRRTSKIGAKNQAKTPSKA